MSTTEFLATTPVAQYHEEESKNEVSKDGILRDNQIIFNGMLVIAKFSDTLTMVCDAIMLSRYGFD